MYTTIARLVTRVREARGGPIDWPPFRFDVQIQSFSETESIARLFDATPGGRGD